MNLDKQKLRAVVATFELLIHTAANRKLAPVVTGQSILVTILYHIKDVANTNAFQNFGHQPADLYRLEESLVYKLEGQIVVIIIPVPLIVASNLRPLCIFISLPFISNFPPTFPVFLMLAEWNSLPLVTLKYSKKLSTSDFPNYRCLGSTIICDGQTDTLLPHLRR